MASIGYDVTHSFAEPESLHCSFLYCKRNPYLVIGDEITTLITDFTITFDTRQQNDCRTKPSPSFFSLCRYSPGAIYF
jgi:hypothetical protein